MKTNQYPAPCHQCGQELAPGTGRFAGKEGSKWLIVHVDSAACGNATPAPQPAQKPTYPPTAEQDEALRLFRTGHPLVIEAGAGAGKTSTLVFLALDAAERGLQGQYTAFNKSIVKDAIDSNKFPSNVAVNTVHSLAFRAVGKRFSARLGKGTKRLRSDQVARFLGIDPFIVDFGGDRKVVQPSQLGGLVLKAIRNFCASVDEVPTEAHIPYVDGIDAPEDDGSRTWDNNRQLRRHIAPALKRAWADLTSVEGELPFFPDVYLKLWALNDPHIDSDFILFDEAQDADPVQLQIVLAQQDHAQLVFVGDTQQAIYTWRGAINSLGTLRDNGANVAFLTQSFRFGEAVAEVANGILDRLSAELRIVGAGPVSVVGEIEQPDAILCRTNATAVSTVLAVLAEGRTPYLEGGAVEVVRFAKAAQRLQNGQSTDHEELSCFESWDEVVDYVEHDENGSDLKLLVKLITDFSPATIIEQLAKAAAKEEDADVTVSTAHKSKGREWNAVQLASDFRQPKDGGELPAEELRLLYVAVTRAKRELDVTAVPNALSGASGVRYAALVVAVEEEIDRTEDARIVAAQRAQEEAASKLLLGGEA